MQFVNEHAEGVKRVTCFNDVARATHMFLLLNSRQTTENSCSARLSLSSVSECSNRSSARRTIGQLYLHHSENAQVLLNADGPHNHHWNTHGERLNVISADREYTQDFRIGLPR